jgi:AAA domain
VILSSVRTKWPGFLKSQPRMNVALTRCRKGMVVVTDKSFLQGKGKKTLLGQLCLTWSKHHDACWNDWKAVLNNLVALPGLPVPSSRSNGTHSPTTPQRNPPSQARARARTHDGQPTLSTSAGSASGSNSVIGSGDRTTTTAVRRDTPRPLANASGQSSRRRSRKGRK